MIYLIRLYLIHLKISLGLMNNLDMLSIQRKVIEEEYISLILLSFQKRNQLNILQIVLILF